MVQREVADRFFAEPGTKAYGAVSVLVQLHARRTGFHPVSRTVFRPRAERRFGARRLRADRFHTRRRSGARGRRAPPSRTGARRSRTRSRSPGSRDANGRSARSRRSAARPTCARRRSQPEEFVRLDRGPRRMSEWRTAVAPAKLNLALVVGPLRQDGKHEVVTVMQRLALADTVALRSAGVDPRVGLRRRHARDRARWTASRPSAAGSRLRGAHREADPRRRRPRWRSARRSDGAPAGQRSPRRPVRRRDAPRARGEPRCRRAVLSHRRPPARHRGRHDARAR